MPGFLELVGGSLLLGWWFGAKGAAQAEVALCAADVFSDLLAEGLGVGPADLGAQAVQKRQGEGCLFVEGDGVEV